MGRAHELFGFQVHDRVICPSGKTAVIVRLRPDGKFDAVYEDLADRLDMGQTTLDARYIQHVEE